MIQEPVRIPTKGGITLDGLVRTPAGSGLFPAVIFAHGLGMTMHEYKGSFDEIAGKLNKIGFLTFQFQFDIFKSDGSVRELPLEERAAQFEEARRWLLSRSDVDTKRVGVLAQSYGVPTALSLERLNLARQGLTFIKSIVFVSGAYFIDKSIRRVYEERGVVINLKGDTTLPRSSGERTTVGKEFWPSLASFDPIAAVQKVTQPVFMIHGDQDTKVATAEAREVFAAIPSTNKRLKIFVGGDHGITDVPRGMREEMLQEVVQWFKKTLLR